MHKVMSAIFILFSTVLLVSADPGENTGGRWELGAGIHKITVDVKLDNATNGDVTFTYNGETMKAQGGWTSDSSTVTAKDGTKFRVRCGEKNCRVEALRKDGTQFTPMEWKGPIPAEFYDDQILVAVY